MDLNLSPSEEAFRQEIRTWFEHNLPPEFQTSRLRTLSEDDAAEMGKQWQRKLGEAGWLGLAWPKEYGGRGATLMEQAIYFSEGYSAQAPLPLDWVGTRLLAPALIDIGHARTQGPLPGADNEGRTGLVPGLLGARRRFRPGQSENPRRRSTAIISSSTGTRSGAPPPSTPIGAYCWRGLIPTCPSIRG